MDTRDNISLPGAVNPQYAPVQMNPYYISYPPAFSQPQLKKLFVGQIPKTYTEEDVKQIFSSTCHVYSAIIIKDKNTMEHKGCAFIYVDPSVAELVKEQYHNKYCCPKMTNKLQVRNANQQRYPVNYPYQPQPVVPTSTIEVPQSINTTPSGDPSAPPAPSSNTNSPAMIQQMPGMYPVPYYPIIPQNLVYPSMMVPVNPPAETTQEPTTAPVMPSVVSPFYMPYMPIPSSDNDSAQPVYPYYQNEAMPMVMTPGGMMMPMQPYTVDQGHQHTNRPQTEEKNRRESVPEANLFVFNLPQNYDDARLKELFQPFGEIMSAKVIFERETNTSKGYGFVNFYNETDAKKAIKEMNGKVVDKKKLTVQVKKPRSG